MRCEVKFLQNQKKAQVPSTETLTTSEHVCLHIDSAHITSPLHSPKVVLNGTTINNSYQELYASVGQSSCP